MIATGLNDDLGMDDNNEGFQGYFPVRNAEAVGVRLRGSLAFHGSNGGKFQIDHIFVQVKDLGKCLRCHANSQFGAALQHSVAPGPRDRSPVAAKVRFWLGKKESDSYSSHVSTMTN